MIEDITDNKFYEDEDDEFDIVKLVSTNANNSNQYLIFNGSNKELYAKNVSKIEELIVYKDLEISHNTSSDSLIVGTANIRGKMTPILYFDEWFGNPVLDDKDYELVILANYGKKRFGIIVKSVEFITSIEAKDMSDNSMVNNKTTFVTNIHLGRKERICTIFDGDKLILDLFGNEEINIKNINIDDKISDKIVLFADDSKFIRQMVKKLLESMKLNYMIFEDGDYLINELENMDIEKLGLVITDLEMPKKDGKEVIDFMRKNEKFNNINIIVHTNMSNNIMESDLLKNGANEIIGKVDLPKLADAIKRNILK